MSVRNNPDGSLSIGILEDMDKPEKPVEKIEPKAEPIVEPTIEPTEQEEAPKKKGRPKKQ